MKPPLRAFLSSPSVPPLAACWLVQSVLWHIQPAPGPWRLVQLVALFAPLFALAHRYDTIRNRHRRLAAERREEIRAAAKRVFPRFYRPGNAYREWRPSGGYQHGVVVRLAGNRHFIVRWRVTGQKSLRSQPPPSHLLRPETLAARRDSSAPPSSSRREP